MQDDGLRHARQHTECAHSDGAERRGAPDEMAVPSEGEVSAVSIGQQLSERAQGGKHGTCKMKLRHA